MRSKSSDTRASVPSSTCRDEEATSRVGRPHGALAALAWSARLGGAPLGRAVLRVLAGGALAMGLTYVIGALFGAAP
jgi:hypothetical protein